jgi:peptidylprolyl isomerase domain and WD repeat-containing protein 1
MYERSLMHRESLTHAVWTPRSEYLVTASVEGVVKFWKKALAGVEFVKLFRAHLGALTALTASADGARLASVGEDRTVKLFDVVGFDLASIAALAFAPSAAAWCFAGGAARAWLAVAERHTPDVHLFNADKMAAGASGAAAAAAAGGAFAVADHVVRLHGAPVLCLAYNSARDCVVSADARGVIEVWSTRAEAGFRPRAGAVAFESKFDTDLLALARAKALPTSLTVSPDGALLGVSATDTRLRVFGFARGNLVRTFDCGEGRGESEGAAGADSGAGAAAAAAAAADAEVAAIGGDLARRVAVEAELREATASALRAFVAPPPGAAAAGAGAGGGPAPTAAGPLPEKAAAAARERELQAAYRPPPSNAVFDETSSLVLFPTMLGVRMADVASGEVVATLGRVEASERFLGLALYQGVPAVSSQMLLARGLVSSSDAMGSKAAAPKSRADPTLVALSFRKQRFFLFSRREPPEAAASAAEGGGAAAVPLSRDVQNEPPSAREIAAAEQGAKEAKRAKLGRQAVLHTSLGDITVQLFGDAAPLAVENFSELARRGYYDGTIFHRVIKGFMAQGGDPTGTGSGGDSIFGGDFADEFGSRKRFDRAGLLAMANGGPNTNGSQFFLTCAPCDWLNNKHTIFGAVLRGLETLKAIEAVRVGKDDRPEQPVTLLGVDVTA